MKTLTMIGAGYLLAGGSSCRFVSYFPVFKVITTSAAFGGSTSGYTCARWETSVALLP